MATTAAPTNGTIPVGAQNQRVPHATERGPSGRPTPDNHPLVQQVVHDVRAYERVSMVTSRAFDAHLTLEHERARQAAHQYDTQAAAIGARGDVARALSSVHRRPADALARFEADVRARGPEAAVETLAMRPETYGALRRDHRLGWRRILPNHEADASARQAAHGAALAAVTMLKRQADAREAPLKTVTMDDAARTAERYRAEVRSLPDKALLERRIAGTWQQLDPAQRTHVEKLLTHTQAAILNTLKPSIREVVLGTGGRER